MTRGRRQLLGTALAALTLVAITAAGRARAADDDLDPRLDNPSGCTTATAEDYDGCGAQGRDHFANARHRPPIEACASSTAATGSRITRVIPDGPRRPDGALAFISGACVYLPPGYATSGLRYPTIYLLHGGGGDEADWVTFGDVQGIFDRAVAGDPARAAIVVMPDGRSGQWYDYEDSSFLIERYVLDHLVPYVDRHFRTLPDRTGRAVVGLSNGGYGAIHLVGKRPDLFVAAGGMSSNLGARTLSGLGEDGAVHHQGSVPYQLAENYDEVDLVLDVANYCTSPDPLCATIAVDLAFTPDHLAFQRRMDEVGHRGELDLRHADGAHQFTWWSRWLEERQLPFVQQRLADPRRGVGAASRVPEEFRYRSIRPRFSVWGYDVTVRRDVREFLDLRSVTASGFQIQGSGQATVVTVAHYRPSETYVVSGALPNDVAQSVAADSTGRLSINVDLGPSHASEQFTDAADVAAATSAAYWTVRTVTIAASPGGTPVAGGSASPVLPGPSTGAGDADAGFGLDAPGAGEAPETDARDDGSPDGRASGGRATAALAAFEPTPQLVPTVLFVAALLGAPAAWWFRRRRISEEDPA